MADYLLLTYTLLVLSLMSFKFYLVTVSLHGVHVCIQFYKFCDWSPSGLNKWVSTLFTLFCGCSPSGKGIISGHADGSVVRFFFEDEGTGESQVNPKCFCSIACTAWAVHLVHDHKPLCTSYALHYNTFGMHCRAKSLCTHVHHMPLHGLPTPLWQQAVIRECLPTGVMGESCSSLTTAERRMNMNSLVLSAAPVVSQWSWAAMTGQ